MPRSNLTSSSSFEAEIGYSRAVIVDEWVIVSGTTGYDYQTGLISADVAQQADQALSNIDQALRRAGSCMADVVRVRYILPQRDDFPQTWAVLKRWFGEVRPAATMMEAGLMKEEMKIEVEVTAKRGCGGSGQEGRA